MRAFLCLVAVGALGAACNASAATPRPGAFLSDLTWPEAEQRLRDAPLVIVPFGAGAKEHGPHLPLGTDQIVMEHLAACAVDSLPVIVAPPILHGWFPAFDDFPGTAIEDPDVFWKYVFETARSLVRHGARRILFLNTGISRSTGLPISIAARELHSRERVPTLVVSWDDLETPETAALARQRSGGHADEIETSILLALRPELVHMDRAVTDYHGAPSDPYPGYRPGGFSRTPGDADFSKTGVAGDPTLATVEKGRQALAIMIRQWMKTLRGFAAAPVSAVK
jgi:creatinine amidohydrolase